MDRKVKSFRLRVDLLDRLKAYADERSTDESKVSEVSVMETALASFFGDATGGVPDLTEETAPPSPAALSPFQHRRGVQRAETPQDWAMDRQRKLNAGKYR